MELKCDSDQDQKRERRIVHYVRRAGAAGKALIVYLATGSIGAALVAYLIFKGAGC